MKYCKHTRLFFNENYDGWCCQDCNMTFELAEVRGEWQEDD